jgi:chlorobactene glucosyltransferase
MIVLMVSAAWLLMVAAMLIRAITQYRHYEVIDPISEPTESPAADITVIVPARDEARNIERCIRALSSQEYPKNNLQIIVVDDHSRDQTAAIVCQLAEHDSRIKLIQSDPLPADWLGKPHACAQAAREARGQWLCFVDADTTAEPMLLATAIQVATQRDADLLSLQPFQELVSPWERLILPCGFFLIAFTQDLRQTSDPSSENASVNGQFLLVNRTAYEGAGGHDAVRGQMAEDSALARNLKQSGNKIMVLGTRGLLRTRMYTSFRALWEGVARQAPTLLRSKIAFLIACVAAILLAALTLALPIASFVLITLEPSELRVTSLILSALGSLALVGTHVGAARFFRIPVWYGLLFPLGYLIGTAVLVYAIWQQSRGKVRWKGRIYAAAQHDAATASGARAVQ